MSETERNISSNDMMICFVESICIPTNWNNNNSVPEPTHCCTTRSENTVTTRGDEPEKCLRYSLKTKILVEPIFLKALPAKIAEVDPIIAEAPINKQKLKYCWIGLLCIVIFAAFSRCFNYSNEIPDKFADLSTNNICRIEDIFKKECPADQDFCQTFRSQLLSTKEKVNLLRDKLHWVINNNGAVVDVKAIEELNDCSQFMVISPDSIDVFDMYSKVPRRLKVDSPIIAYTMSINKEILIYSLATGDIFRTNINKFSENEKITNSWFSQSNDVHNIIRSKYSNVFFVTFKNLREVHCYTFNKTKKIFELKEIKGRVSMLEVNQAYNDVILMDSDGIKIYFNHTDKPAFIIRDWKELIKLKETYIELELFEKEFKNFLKIK